MAAAVALEKCVLAKVSNALYIDLIKSLQSEETLRTVEWLGSGECGLMTWLTKRRQIMIARLMRSVLMG